MERAKTLLGIVDDEVKRVVYYWNLLNDPYAQLAGKARTNRAFFMGEQWDASELKKRDRIHRVFNYGSAIIRKYQNYEGYPPFDINVKVADDDPISILMAEAAEALCYRIIENSDYSLSFLESRLAKGLYGTIFQMPRWNVDNKNGSKKGTVEIDVASPEKVRVGYLDNDYKVPYVVVSVKRMPVQAANELYGDLVDGEILPDRLIMNTDYISAVRDYASSGSQLYVMERDDLVTIWNYHDTKEYILNVGHQNAIHREHKIAINGKTICPVVPGHNIYVPGFIHGLSDFHFIEGGLQALNKLYSLLEEVVEDNGYPIMFEINNSLRGTKLKRGEMRGKVIPMTVDPGEKGIDVLQPPAVVQPIIAAIQEVKNAVFDISHMPAAAFGAYQPNTKSGFQTTVQMQPMLQEINTRQLRAKREIADILRMSLAILEVHNPEALKVTLPEERDPIDGSIIAPAQEIKLSGLQDHEIDIIFGNPMPKDDVRVLQNETAKVSNKLQSRRTAMQNLGIESPTKEMNLIDEEDKKLAQVQAEVQKILLEAQQVTNGALAPGANGADKGATSRIKKGQNPEQAFPTNPADKAPVADTAGEAVADTSIL